jgi:hypothetical protein
MKAQQPSEKYSGYRRKRILFGQLQAFQALLPVQVHALDVIVR